MKKQLLFLLFITLLSCDDGSSIINDNSTLEKLGDTFISAVITQNSEILNDKVFTQASDYKAFRQQHLGRWTDALEEDLPTYIENFSKIPSSALRVKSEFNRLGLNDWSEVKFEKMTYKDASRNNAVMYNNVYLDFTNGEYKGVIKIGSLAQTKSGWLLLNQPEVQGYSKFSL